MGVSYGVKQLYLFTRILGAID
jgi:hypothetical protein